MTNCTLTNTSYQCSTEPEFVGYIFIFTPVAISGVIMNILNLAVFTRATLKMNQSTLMYLVALAVADLGTVIFVGPLGIVRCIPVVHAWETYARSYYMSFVFLPIGNSFASISVYLTVVISAERYMCVKYSTISKRFNKTWMTQLCIALTALVALGMNVPYFFSNYVDDDGTSTKTEFGSSDKYEKYGWARLILNKVIPIILVSVFNVLLVVTVVASSRRSSTLGLADTTQIRRQRRQTRLTAMMIAISLTFVVCHAMEPLTHGGVYQAIFGPCSTYSPSYRLLSMAINILEVFSNSCNFIFFCIFYREFQKGLRHVLCCCLDNRIGPTSAGATSFGDNVTEHANACQMNVKKSEKPSLPVADTVQEDETEKE